MNKVLLGFVAMALLPAYSFAAEGQILINQASVMAAGGFPYKITQPGSYKFSGSLVVPANTTGILISALNVTLDLNGSSVTTPQQLFQGAGTYVGIGATGALGVTIRNGMISGFIAPMIPTDQPTDWILEDLTFTNGAINSGPTLSLGWNSRVFSCQRRNSLDCRRVSLRGVRNGFHNFFD